MRLRGLCPVNIVLRDDGIRKNGRRGEEVVPGRWLILISRKFHGWRTGRKQRKKGASPFYRPICQVALVVERAECDWFS